MNARRSEATAMGQCWCIVAYLQLRDPNVLVGLMARMAPPRGALWAARAPSKAVWETQAETDESAQTRWRFPYR